MRRSMMRVNNLLVFFYLAILVLLAVEFFGVFFFLKYAIYLRHSGYTWRCGIGRFMLGIGIQ